MQAGEKVLLRQILRECEENGLEVESETKWKTEKQKKALKTFLHLQAQKEERLSWCTAAKHQGYQWHCQFSVAKKFFSMHFVSFSCMLQLSYFTGQGILNDVNVKLYFYLPVGYE